MFKSILSEEMAGVVTSDEPFFKKHSRTQGREGWGIEGRDSGKGGGGLKETKNFDDQLWDSVEGRVDTKKWSLN